MTQLLDYAHGTQAIPPRLPEERDYGQDLATVLTPALRARLRDARAGLGLIRPGSPAHGLMAKAITALEAEITRRTDTTP